MHSIFFYGRFFPGQNSPYFPIPKGNKSNSELAIFVQAEGYYSSFFYLVFRLGPIDIRSDPESLSDFYFGWASTWIQSSGNGVLEGGLGVEEVRRDILGDLPREGPGKRVRTMVVYPSIWWSGDLSGDIRMEKKFQEIFRRKMENFLSPLPFLGGVFLF